MFQISGGNWRTRLSALRAGYAPPASAVVLPDGRVVWRTDSGAELTALPESLVQLEGN